MTSNENFWPFIFNNMNLVNIFSGSLKNISLFGKWNKKYLPAFLLSGNNVISSNKNAFLRMICEVMNSSCSSSHWSTQRNVLGIRRLIFLNRINYCSHFKSVSLPFFPMQNITVKMQASVSWKHRLKANHYLSIKLTRFSCSPTNSLILQGWHLRPMKPLFMFLYSKFYFNSL